MAIGIVPFGSYYLGKTYQVPKTLWVSTRFLHVLFFPFVPRSSWIWVHPSTVADLGLPSDAFPLPLQPRSLLLAWLRALLGLVLTIGSLVSVTKYLLDRPLGDQLGAAMFVIGPILLLAASYQFDRPGAARIEELLRRANVPAPLVARAQERLANRA